MYGDSVVFSNSSLRLKSSQDKRLRKAKTQALDLAWRWGYGGDGWSPAVCSADSDGS